MHVLIGNFLIIDLVPYLIGMWFSEDQRTNTQKYIFEEIALHLQVLLPITHSIVNTIGHMYLIQESTNMHL